MEVNDSAVIVANDQTTGGGGVGGRTNDRGVLIAFSPRRDDEAADNWQFESVEIEGLTAQPGDVVMYGPGEIIFQRSPANASWKFAGAAVKHPGDQFKVRVPRSGELLIIRDDWRELGKFPYLIIVQDSAGNYHMSEDPVIVNADPG